MIPGVRHRALEVYYYYYYYSVTTVSSYQILHGLMDLYYVDSLF